MNFAVESKYIGSGVIDVIETAIAGIRITRAYTAEGTEIDKFNTENEKFKSCRGEAYRAMGLFIGISAALLMM